MNRMISTAVLVAATVAAAGAFAQGAGKIPVEQDLRRLDRIEQRIEERTGLPVADPYSRPVDPGGVPGFNGPPGIIGDSVNSYGPLPQGAAGNDIR